ncbi:UPF0223 family protein [Streptococcus pantholopis]|uniref:UPF0223 protein A0O21_04805 n=1 Tax=Streptococcus pantholopis TaxID=1811193 RepID=A0A172Q7F8_9STRE|nr:UPF0223 family protein [Streptococcus pantholopis]AND79398.1 hypothetical protein A0O21_04805 [Streptococcus pantholopis]
MSKNYSYPLDTNWSTEEIISVLYFLNQVEKAYESKVSAAALLETYTAFKQVVTSKAQEKTIDRDFKRSSGYSIYKAVKAAKERGKGFISLGN